jgi:ACS family D-galactonate transporter-like MFS transporter
MGLLIDRFGVRRLGCYSAAVVTAASLVSSVAPNVGSLFAARFLLGIGESPLFPANAKAIGKWFPPKQRGRATSAFDSAAKLASGIGVPLVGMILLKFGWRWSFATTGIGTLLYLLLFATTYRDPPADASVSAGAISEGTPSIEDFPPTARYAFTLPQLLAQPRVIGMAIAMLSYNYTFYMVLTWLPTYLARQMHIDLMHSFLYTGIPWIIATFVEILVGGIVLDWLVSRSAHPGKLRLYVVAAGLLCGLGIAGAGFAQSVSSAVFWITISIAGTAAATPCIWSAPSLIAPESNVGTVGGIMNLSGQCAGICAPICTGYLVTLTHSFAAAFLVAAAILLIGTLACILLVRSIEPIRVS